MTYCVSRGLLEIMNINFGNAQLLEGCWINFDTCSALFVYARGYTNLETAAMEEILFEKGGATTK